ncbi:MAG TPA: PH domain-containing protein [Candidatus Saccharimonadia bacterium]|nr:PH domain-containing protein [Candidatus Saccharimonadia bacterium]
MGTKVTPNQQAQFPGQLNGEAAVLMFRQHPLVMRKALLFGLLAVTLGVLPLDFVQIYESPAVAGFFTKLALIVPLLVLVVWFYRWVGWYYSIYVVTDRRIVAIAQKGFFDRAVQEWQLDKIYNVNYHVNGFQAAIFGYGDIVAKTVIGEFVMPKIHHPTEIHRHIMEAVQAVGGGQGTPFDN